MPPSAPATDGTADLILDAAERLFAERGYDGCTVKQIGAAAKVNPALLSYYFGGKEGTYRAAIGRRLRAFATEGMQGMSGAGSPTEAIRHFAEAYMRFMLRHPTVPKLLIREVLDHDAEHAVEEVRIIASGPFKALCDVVRAGQAGGEFRTDLDPARAAISILSPLVYILVARPIVGILLTGRRRGLTDDAMRDFAAHAAEFALVALAPRARPERP
jgi:TetR/AcrR family transcriptional regulator